MSRLTQCLVLLGTVIAVLLGLAGAAHATAYYWAGGNGNWNDPAKWLPPGVPGTIDGQVDQAYIQSAGSCIVTIPPDLPAVRLNALSISNGGGAILQNNGSSLDVTLDDGATPPSTTLGLNCMLATLGAVAAPGLTSIKGGALEGSVMIGHDATLRTEGQVNISGSMQNSGTFRCWDGTVNFNQGASYNAAALNGMAEVSAGYLNFNIPVTALGRLAVVGMGYLNFFDTTANMTGSSVTITGTGALLLNSNLTVATLTMTNGAITGAGGLLINTSMDWSGGTMMSTGVTQLAATATGTLANTVTLDGTRALLNNGTLTAADTTKLAIGNSASVTNGGTFIWQGAGQIDGGIDGQYYYGPLINTGVFRKTQTGTLTNSSDTNNTNGTTDVLGGQLSYTYMSTNAGATFTVAAGATLAFDGGYHQFLEQAQAITGVSATDKGTVLLNNQTAVALPETYDVGATTVSGSSMVTFDKGAPQAGDFALLGGSVIVTQGRTLAVNTANLSAGTLYCRGTLDAAGLVTWSGALLSGDAAGVGFLNANAGLILTGATAKEIDNNLNILNAGSGAWQGGDLQCTGNVTFTNAATGVFDIQCDAALTEDVPGGTFINNGLLQKTAGTGTTAIALAFTNTGTVIAGSGNLTFTATYTQTAGETRLQNGTIVNDAHALAINGGLLTGSGSIAGDVSVAAGATVRPGASAGLLEIGGDLELAGNLDAEIGGTASTAYDRITVGGTATITAPATLTVTLLNDFQPHNGNSFTLLDAGTLTGTFATPETLPTLDRGRKLAVAYSATAVTVNTTVNPVASLVFLQQPQDADVNASLGDIVLSLRDASGQEIDGATDAVTMAISTDPAGGSTLAGTTTVNAVDGQVTFSGLSLNKAGTGFTLKASAGAITSADSDPFDITATAGPDTFQPDLWVSGSGQADDYHGQDIFNLLADQTVEKHVTAGGQTTFYLMLQNDGTAEDTLTLTGPSETWAWTVQYFAGNDDITGEVTQDGKGFTLAAQATTVVRVVVQASTGATTGDTLDLPVSLSSAQDNTKSDAGQLTTAVVGNMTVYDAIGRTFGRATLRALLLNPNGTPVVFQPVTFSVANVVVGTVLTNTYGQASITYDISNKPIGPYAIRADYYGTPAASGEATLTVTRGVTTQLTLTGSSAAVTADDTVTYTVTASDGVNAWDVTKDAVYCISAEALGVFTNGGTAEHPLKVYAATKASPAGIPWTVFAMYDGVQTSTTLAVTHGIAQGIAIAPASQTVESGSIVTFTANAHDADGNTWEVTGATSWDDHGANGNFSPTQPNLYTAGNTGTVTITGTLGALSADSTLTIKPLGSDYTSYVLRFDWNWNANTSTASPRFLLNETAIDNLPAGKFYDLGTGPAQVQIQVISGNNKLTAKITQYDPDGELGPAAAIDINNVSLACNWIQNSRSLHKLYSLTQVSTIGASQMTANYYASFEETLVGTQWKNGFWALTQTLIPANAVVVSDKSVAF